MEPSIGATLAMAHAHGHGKAVELAGHPVGSRPAVAADGSAVAAGGAAARPAATPTAVTPLRDWTRAGPYPAAVARTLRAALAPRRWEPWNRYQEHRAYPSPRSAYLVDVTVSAGDRRWAVDPVRELLTPLNAAAPRAPAGTRMPAGTRVPAGSRAPAAGEPVELLLEAVPDRLPAGYGALAWALAWLECGHVAAALAEAAAGTGLAADPYQESTQDRIAVTLRPGGAHTWPWSRVMARRSSGLGPRGFAPDPRPLSPETLPALAAAIAAPPGSPARYEEPGPRQPEPGGAGAPLRHRLAVNAVTATTEGWYAVAGGRPRLESAGPAMEAVRRAAGQPDGAVDVAGMNIGWVMTADIAGAVRAGGPDQYRRLLLRAGATAQHVATAAAARGLFCRPIRNVDEAALEAAAGAPAGHDFLYLLLIGRAAVRDFSYDLTDPELAPPPGER